MKTVAEIFKIAGISSNSMFERDHAIRLYEIGVLTGIWYANVITLDEYRSARSALSVLHNGMLN